MQLAADDRKNEELIWIYADARTKQIVGYAYQCHSTPIFNTQSEHQLVVGELV